MPQVTLRDKHQITLPASIVRAARLAPNDVLSVEYVNGKITLSSAATKAGKRPSLMDYAGITEGLYGQSAEEVHAYLAKERQSWE